MARKVKVWLDTGVSIHSAFKQEMSIDEFGYNEDEWNDLDMDDQFQIILDMCYGFGWGVEFVDDAQHED